MSKAKSYQQLNNELAQIVRELDNELDDIDKAIELHGKGEKIIAEIEEYLKKTKAKIAIINKQIKK